MEAEERKSGIDGPVLVSEPIQENGDHKVVEAVGESGLSDCAGAAACSTAGGASVQPSPSGVREILVERISVLRQDNAEQIADLVLGEGVSTAVDVLASPQALEDAVNFVVEAGVVPSAKPSDGFIEVARNRKGSKRARRRGGSDELDGVKTTKSHRGMGGRGRGSGRGRGRGSLRGRGGVTRTGAGDQGRTEPLSGTVDKKLRTQVRDMAPDLSDVQVRQVSVRLLKMNKRDRSAALDSVVTLRQLASLEGGYSRADKERQFGRQLYIKVLQFRTGKAQSIVDALMDLPVERLRTLLGSKDELASVVQRTCATMGGPARTAGDARRGSRAAAKDAKDAKDSKRKPQRSRKARTGERRGVSGGTSAASRSKNEEKSPVLTRAHVNKGSAWQLPMLGEQGKWIPRRSEDTSEDSEDDDTRQSLDGQPVGDVPAAKDSGPERPEDKALTAALECSAGTNHGLFSGYVIRVKGTTVSVLYGRNEVAQVNRPSRGAYAKVRFGDAVVLARRVRFISGKAAKVTYGFAALKKEEKFVPTAEKMVAMKAVMLVVAGDGADGVAVLPALGIKVSVTAANAEELCKLSNLEAAAGGLCGERGGAVGGSGAGCLPVGSSFFFFPTFQGGKVLLERVCPFGISIAEAGSATAVPATSVDLCPGFLLPDSRVQDLAGQHLQVEAMPFVDESRHAFAYGMGANGVHQMLVAKGDTRQDFLYHKRVEEAMVKAEAIRNGRVASPSDRSELLSGARKCLVVPEAAYLQKYAAWLKRDMKTAAGRGDRLRVVVGCFVDEECTTGSIYNTEDIPLLNQDNFPWVVSVTLIDGHVQCFSFDGRDRFVLSDASRVGKKLALVELDSFAGGVGTLPVPGVLVPDPLACDVDQRPAEVNPGVDVLVSLPVDDNRRQLLIDKCSASVYKKKGALEILSVPFATAAKAKQFVLNIADGARGVFAMLKSELYCEGALTLSCDTGPKAASIAAGELFFLLRATGVLPIGGGRYRIATAMPMLEAAHILHFQNCYVQLDAKKFKVLRNDHDEYVHLDTKKAPKSIMKYYRKVPERFSATGGVDKSCWFQIQNLPRWVTLEGLSDTLCSLRWWPASAGNPVVSRATHYPVAFFSLEHEQHRSCVPASVVIGGRPCALMPSAPPPMEVVKRVTPSFCSQQGLAALASFPTPAAWSCSAKTKNLVTAKYKKHRRKFLAVPRDSAQVADSPGESKVVSGRTGRAGRVVLLDRKAGSQVASVVALDALESEVKSANEPGLQSKLLEAVKSMLSQEHLSLAGAIADNIYSGAATDAEVGSILASGQLDFLVEANLSHELSRSQEDDDDVMEVVPEAPNSTDEDLESSSGGAGLVAGAQGMEDDSESPDSVRETTGAEESLSGSEEDFCGSSDADGSRSSDSEEDDEESENEHEDSESGESSQEELAQTEAASSTRAANSHALHGDGSEESAWSAPVLAPLPPWGPKMPNFLQREREARESFIAALDRTRARGADKKQ